MRLRKILLVMVVLYSCGKDQQTPIVSGTRGINTPVPTNPNPPTPTPGQTQVPIPKIENLRWYPNNIWQESWSNAVVDKVTEVGLTRQEVAIDDLSDLECLGYTNASERQRAMFWLVVMASVSAQESAFDPKDRYYERSLGEWSEGLMQLSVSDKSRGNICHSLDTNTILDPHVNLECAVTILKDQLEGSSTRVPNQIFPTRMYYWSTLTRTSTKTEVIAFFKKHLDRLSFCSGS